MDGPVLTTIAVIALAALVLLAMPDARPPHNPRRDRDPDGPPTP